MDAYQVAESLTFSYVALLITITCDTNVIIFMTRMLSIYIDIFFCADVCLTYENQSALKREKTKWKEGRDIWWEVSVKTENYLTLVVLGFSNRNFTLE